jgi:hypothetical protein
VIVPFTKSVPAMRPELPPPTDRACRMAHRRKHRTPCPRLTNLAALGAAAQRTSATLWKRYLPKLMTEQGRRCADEPNQSRSNVAAVHYRTSAGTAYGQQLNPHLRRQGHHHQASAATSAPRAPRTPRLFHTEARTNGVGGTTTGILPSRDGTENTRTRQIFPREALASVDTAEQRAEERRTHGPGPRRRA